MFRQSPLYRRVDPLNHENEKSNPLKKEELFRLGQNIKRLRKARGMNQTLLAEKAQTRPTTISTLENAINTNPGWNLLIRIANVLNTSIHKLTQPDSSQISKDVTEQLPQGLVDLLRYQDDLLSPTEDRIRLNEVEWLKKLPIESAEKIGPSEYLHVLRHFRLLLNQK